MKQEMFWPLPALRHMQWAEAPGLLRLRCRKVRARCSNQHPCLAELLRHFRVNAKEFAPSPLQSIAEIRDTQSSSLALYTIRMKSLSRQDMLFLSQCRWRF